MKKIIIMLLALSLILAGCGKAPADPEASESPVTENATENVPEDTTQAATENSVQTSASLPMTTVSVPVITREITADDGTVIYREVTQNMRLVMQDPDVADRIIVDFLNRIDQVTGTGEDTMQQAKNDYAPSAMWTPYLCSITYAPQRIDQSVLSLFGTNVSFSGSAHAVQAPCAANYNVMTGDVLTLGSIITDEGAVDKLCELTIQQLNAIAEEKYLYDGFEESVKNRFATEESYDENWYFTTTGLRFYFDPYAIAPYASGIVTVEIPYAGLLGIIDDAFFPTELEECSGAIITAAAESADMSQFTRISEVIIDPEAPMYVISCDSTVQNLRITLTDAELSSGYTIFAAQTLGASDAVVVQAEESLFHRIDVIYESNGQTVTVPLLAE